MFDEREVSSRFSRHAPVTRSQSFPDHDYKPASLLCAVPRLQKSIFKKTNIVITTLF
jgi:hypothetical protein